jgi:hypothetical protein
MAVGQDDTSRAVILVDSRSDNELQKNIKEYFKVSDIRAFHLDAVE